MTLDCCELFSNNTTLENNDLLDTGDSGKGEPAPLRKVKLLKYFRPLKMRTHESHSEHHL